MTIALVVFALGFFLGRYDKSGSLVGERYGAFVAALAVWMGLSLFMWFEEIFFTGV